MKRKALKRCLGMTLSLVLSVSTVFSGVTPAYAEPVAEETEGAPTEAEAEVTTDEAAGEQTVAETETANEETVSSTEDTEEVEDAAASNIAPAAEENGTDDKSGEVKSEKESAVTETEVRIEGSRENNGDATAETDDADESEETDAEDLGDEFSDEDLSAEGVGDNFDNNTLFVVDDLRNENNKIDPDIGKLITVLGRFYETYGRSLFNEEDYYNTEDETASKKVTAKQIITGANIRIKNEGKLEQINLGDFANSKKSDKFNTDLKVTSITDNEIAEFVDLSVGSLDGYVLKSFDGIGYLRKTQKFDLSGISDFNEVQDKEFYQSEVESVILPDSVTKLGVSSFQGCGNLKEVRTKSGQENTADLTNINNIGSNAFNGCGAMDKVIFQGSMTETTDKVRIGDHAFVSCAIESVEIPVTETANLGEQAFQNCKKLKTVYLRDSLKGIPAGLFSQAGKNEDGMRLISIDEKSVSANNVLPRAVVEVGTAAFQDSGIIALVSPTVESVNEAKDAEYKKNGLPLKTISDQAFKGSYIRMFDAENYSNLEMIGRQAFNSTHYLLLVELGQCNKLTVVGAEKSKPNENGGEAFSFSSLVKISLPPSLSEIQKNTFSQDPYLQVIELVAPGENQPGLEIIGEKAFEDCVSLRNTDFLKNTKNLKLIDTYAFHMESTIFPQGEANSRYKDANEFGLTKVWLPKSGEETILGTGCFENNYYLESIDLKDSTVKTIPDSAFRCDSESISHYHTVDKNLKTDTVSSKLLEVILPENLEDIGQYAFANCVSLNKMGVNDKSKDGYVRFPDSLNKIGPFAFSKCKAYEHLELPELIDEVGNNVFEQNTGLVDARLGGLKNIAASAFRECDKLTNVYVSSEVEHIRDNAFYNDKQLVGLTERKLNTQNYLPVNLKDIGVSAFQGCGSLTKIVVPSEVVSIGANAYASCRGEDPEEAPGLEQVDLTRASSLKEIGGGAFSDNPINQDIRFNDSAEIATINSNLFGNCEKLQAVYFPDSVTKVNSRVFYDCESLAAIQLPVGASIDNAMVQASTAEKLNRGLTITLKVTEKARVPYKQLVKVDIRAIQSNTCEVSTVSCTKRAIKDSADVSVYQLKKGTETNLSESGYGGVYTSDECPIAVGIGANNSVAFYGREYTDDKYDYTVTISTAMSLRWGNASGQNLLATAIPTYEFSVENNPVAEYDFTDNKTNSMKYHPDYLYLKSEDIGKTIPLTIRMKGVIENGYVSGISEWTTGDSGVVSVESSAMEKKEEAGTKVTKSTVNLKINGYGHTQLTVDTDEVTKTIEVYVVDPIDSFDIRTNLTGKTKNPIAVDKRKDDTLEIKAENISGRFSGSTEFSDEIFFVSENEKILDVNQQTGRIFDPDDEDGSHYTGQESVKIFAISKTGKASKTITVNLKSNDAYIKATGFARESINVGEEVKIEDLGILPINATTVDSWSIKSGENLISLDGEKIIGLEKGQVILNGTQKETEEKTAEVEFKLTVTDPAPTPAEDGVNALTAPNGLAVPVNGSETFAICTKLPESGADQGKRKWIVTTEEFTEELQYEFVDDDGNTDEDSVSYSLPQNGTTHSITVTGKKEGTTNLLIKNSKGEQLALLPVTVYQPAENAPTATVTTQVDQVALSPTSKTVQLQAKADNNEPIVWWTSDPALATVDSNGLVTYKGEKAGDVVIYAGLAHNADKAEKFTIRVVKEPISTFRIVDKPIELAVGASFSIGATADAAAEKGLLRLPETSNETWTWSTSNASIATVDKGDNGSVSIKGIAPGQVTVTATSNFGKKATYTFKVVSVATAIEGSDETQGYVGTTLALGSKIKVTPAGATETRVWTSSDEKVATVDAAGNVKLLSKGDVTISVKGNVSNVGKQWSIHVRVPSTKVVLKTTSAADTKLYMLAGNSYQLRYNISPDPQDPNGTEDKVTFKSSKKKVATVDENGLITAKKKGKAVITIKTESGKTDKITVNVVKKELASGKITVKTASVKKGKTVRLKLKLKKSKSTDTLTYAVNKPKLATIDEFGYLKALKKGTVKVTVTSSSGAKTTKKIKIK